MKLIKFEAIDVYDYLKININFNEDLSFLVGGNGSGKTTAIKLIHAILTPTLKDLYTIPFKSFMLTINIEGNDEDTLIKVTKNDNLAISISDIKQTIELPKFDEDEYLDYKLHQIPNTDDFFDNLVINYKETEVMNFIKTLEIPIFLGLERRSQNKGTGVIRRRPLNNRHRRLGQPLNNITGILAISLNEIQSIIQDIYENMRAHEDTLRIRLRDNIISSSFQYIDFSTLINDKGELNMPTVDEKRHILNRRSEIENLLENLGTNTNKFSKNINDFFTKMDNLFESMKDITDTKGVAVEWITNLAQIDRIEKLIEMIDENKIKINKRFESINLFLDSINYFFEDSGKKVLISKVGQLQIKKPNGNKSNIDALSSGERQLLVLFAQLIFNNDSNSSNVFIIDEPELSLHLKWQDEFVKYALKLSPKTQLIMATHSPEIFAGYEHKTLQING